VFRRYHKSVTRTVSAVYENGVLRPSEPLPLAEHERVNVTVSDTRDRAEAWLDHEYMVAIDAIDEPAPTLEEVRRILSKTSGKLSDAIRAERDARG
jgi:predicted DNA-binding antitoxin AbrB/MazE fold protein